MNKEFGKPKILERARLLEGKNICDNCFGRQFAQVSTGLTNKKRGEILRKLLKAKGVGKCEICTGLFQGLEKFLKLAERGLKKYEFRTFAVGCKPGKDLISREEGLWEEIGVDFCEPLKSEFNREVGKLIEKKLGRKAELKDPEIRLTFFIEDKRLELQIKPLFVYGEYQKLVRGIPQTKWDKYKITVEDIIAKPFMPKTRGIGHAFHGCGREDIDARCLGWRPFVLEIEEPRVRKISLKEMLGKVNKGKKVKVRKLRFSNKKEVVRIKSIKPDKTYRVLVQFEKALKPKDLKVLKGLVGKSVRQRTPKRVAHRRADLERVRKVKALSWKGKDKKFEFKIKGEAGLYIKELVTGDGGRTKPSISELVGVKAAVKELDVIGIHVVS